MVTTKDMIRSEIENIMFFRDWCWDQCCSTSSLKTWTERSNTSAAGLLAAQSCGVQSTSWREGMPARGISTSLIGGPV